MLVVNNVYLCKYSLTPTQSFSFYQESFPIYKRQHIPHGVSFHDHPMKLFISCDTHKAEFTIDV